MRLGLFVQLALMLTTSSALATPPEPPRSNSVVVFDSADRVCDRIDLKVTCCGAIDVSGKYRIILVRPRRTTGNIISVSRPSAYLDTLVIFAWTRGDELVPIFPWQQFRAASRPRSDRLDSTWKDLEIAEVARKAHVAYPTVAWPSQLWALKLPARVAAAQNVELQVLSRPEWQRMFARKVDFPALGAGAHDVVSSRESTYLNSRLTSVADAISFTQRVAAHEDRVDVFYLPRRPLIAGDVVNLTLPATGASKLIRCHAGADVAFPRIILRGRADKNAEPTVIVNVGGIAAHPTGFTRLQGAMELPDGERIEFAGSTRNGVFIEWPAHCPLTGSTFWVDGTASGPGGTQTLVRTFYTCVPQDAAFVGAPTLIAVRIDPPCAVEAPLDVGGSLRVSLAPEREDCPVCHCFNCRSW
jgi:hypothetical protein